jgi:hypothetical protein
LARIIHNDLGRTKHFVAATVTTLDNFEDDMIRLAGVVSYRHGLLPVRVERLACSLDGFDAMAVEQLA